jgi:S1-C subfamily serine protease
VAITTRKYSQAIQDSTEQNHKTGSGVLISPDGYIVTNYHVVSNGQSINIRRSDRSTYNAEVIATDSTYDLALIKIPGNHLPFLEFGNIDSLQVGESVIAVGNPYKLNFTVTSGIVSAKNRDLKAEGNATRTFIQTDVPMNTGNSGGPLMNARGELMGIMSIMVTVSGQNEGYAFAMPSDLVQKIIGDLKLHGKRRRAALGMVIRPVTTEIAAYAKLSKITGVVIDALTDGGNADLAGLRSLDVIMSVDGQEVESVPAFLGTLALRSPGDTMHLVVNRDGTEMAIDVVCEESKKE